jgi:hypothetical protein
MFLKKHLFYGFVHILPPFPARFDEKKKLLKAGL